MTIDKTTQNQSLHNIEDCLACEGLPKRFNGSGLYVECKKYHPTSETEKTLCLAYCYRERPRKIRTWRL